MILTHFFSQRLHYFRAKKPISARLQRYTLFQYILKMISVYHSGGQCNSSALIGQFGSDYQVLLISKEKTHFQSSILDHFFSSHTLRSQRGPPTGSGQIARTPAATHEIEDLSLRLNYLSRSQDRGVTRGVLRCQDKSCCSGLRKYMNSQKLQLGHNHFRCWLICNASLQIHSVAEKRRNALLDYLLRHFIKNVL